MLVLCVPGLSFYILIALGDRLPAKPYTRYRVPEPQVLDSTV